MVVRACTFFCWGWQEYFLSSSQIEASALLSSTFTRQSTESEVSLWKYVLKTWWHEISDDHQKVVSQTKPCSTRYNASKGTCLRFHRVCATCHKRIGAHYLKCENSSGFLLVRTYERWDGIGHNVFVERATLSNEFGLCRGNGCPNRRHSLVLARFTSLSWTILLGLVTPSNKFVSFPWFENNLIVVC